ncbi:MAG: amino acid ABC transporter substrate-binding protein [bacterium]|nr:amino acid ABC transporter substrate-binding protein [bacterium]
MRKLTRRVCRWVLLGALVAVLAGGLAAAPVADAAKPLKIGFSMALTGPLGPAGKAALLAMEIWRDDMNAQGGLLGRKVELVYYDDQTKPANVPGIYAKLLDVDKVDFVVSPYGTNLIVPALPIVMERGLVFMSLFGLDANHRFKYNNYFQIMPSGEDPAVDQTRGFFEIAMKQKPRPKTIAFLSADSEFARNVVVGGRKHAKRLGLKILYDKRYPFPGTTDFTPILRAVKATNPDLFFVGSYPGGSIGIVKAANEIGLKPKLWGGGMVGLQYTAIQMNLGPLLNGIVDYWFWAPEPTLKFPGINEFLKKYQEQAPAKKLDPLGYYLPPFAYAYVQVLGDAIKATKSFDQAKVGAYIRDNTHSTVVGDVKFGKNGEWKQGRTLLVQLQGIKGHSMEEFTMPGKMVVLYPPKYKSGNLIYPYEKAR